MSIQITLEMVTFSEQPLYLDWRVVPLIRLEMLILPKHQIVLTMTGIAIGDVFNIIRNAKSSGTHDRNGQHITHDPTY